jgi:integrase
MVAGSWYDCGNVFLWEQYKLANRQVSLMRKCKTPKGWRRYPVVMSANGKVKPDAVSVNGKEYAYSVGHYELRSYKGAKVVWTRVDGGATEALAALKLAQKRATAAALAQDAGIQVVSDPARVSIRDAAQTFTKAAQDRGSKEAAEIYKRTMDDFQIGCTKFYVDEITREDVSKFHVHMKARGLSERTVHNRHMALRAFLLSLGLDVKVIAGKAPRYDKTMPEIFEREELASFFKSLQSDYDRLLFSLLLKTGLREREVAHLEWADISLSRRTLQVRSKPAHGHRIKDAEERELPIPEELATQLQSYRSTVPGSYRLVFGKKGGKHDSPDGHLLRRLKLLVKNAELNCRVCNACMAVGECERWFLHKFRATFCTTLLRSGMDLRTVQRLAGHSDLASTMRYLRPAGTMEVLDKVDAVSWF